MLFGSVFVLYSVKTNKCKIIIEFFSTYQNSVGCTAYI